MKQRTDFSFVLIIFLFFSCQKGNDLSTYPFQPITDANRDDLIRWGFEAEIIDDGFCSYAKAISRQVKIYFMMNFEDECYQTNLQGIQIQLDSLKKIIYEGGANEEVDFFYQLNKKEFYKDSLKILDIITKYGGEKISNTSRLEDSEDLEFKVKDTVTGAIFDCLYTGYPSSIKRVYMEHSWN